MLKQITNAIETRRYKYFNARKLRLQLENPVVSFSFDDFPESATTAATLLEQRGWRGTFYYSPGLAGQDSAVGPLASLDTARQLHAAGHEIAHHTNSHLRCQGTSKAALRHDLGAASGMLEVLGGSRNFSLPFGAHDPSALNVLSDRFDTIRTVDAGINSGMIDLNLLKANRLYGNTTIESSRALIEEVQACNGWLIFYTHDVCDKPSPFGCTADQFAQVLALVAERGLAVKTVEEVVAGL